jgi:hypothetical protein
MGEEEEEKLLEAFRELLRDVGSPNHLPAASPPPPQIAHRGTHHPATAQALTHTRSLAHFSDERAGRWWRCAATGDTTRT